jgi:alpha-ketoglutarate-dependent taurine dioxygenase
VFVPISKRACAHTLQFASSGGFGIIAFMSIEFRRLGAQIGVEAVGINLDSELSAAEIAALRQQWLESTVLVIRRQALTAEGLLRATQWFGKPICYTRAENALPGYPSILVLSNIKKDGKPIGTPVSGRYWHTDGHYLPIPPAASILYGVEVPKQGGDTWFANCQAAYDALPLGTRQRIDGLQVIISQAQARPIHYPQGKPATVDQVARWRDTAQPFVRTHPETGRRSLYIGAGVPWRVAGMPDEDSAPLVTSLQEFATSEPFVYRHKWCPGDFVLMDNRSSIHRGTAYDTENSRRLLYRTTMEGDSPFFRVA